jgi:hypothetical protein
MAGLVRPKSYPIRKVTDDKQSTAYIYQQHRFAHHGGLDSASKYPAGDTGFRSVEPPTKINPAEVSNRNLSE